MQKQKRLHILLNPSSGRERSLTRLEPLKSALIEAHITYEVSISQHHEHLQQLVHDYGEAEDYDWLGVMGGDSTLAIVVNEWMKLAKPLPLVLIGAGSSDDVVRHLGIKEVSFLVAALKRGQTRSLDLGYIDYPIEEGGPWQRFYFPGQANVGLGVFVNRYVEKHKRKESRRSRYPNLLGLRGIWRAYARRLLPLELAITQDGVSYRGLWDIALFTNIRYWSGGLHFAPGAEMEDGRLELVLARQKGFFSLVRMALRSRKGEHVDGNRVHLLRGSEFHVQSDKPLQVQIDGDILLYQGKELPLRSFVIGVAPHALRVIV